MKVKEKSEKKKGKKAIASIVIPANAKSKCCKKYKDGEKKRCSRCPCFDLCKK